MKKCYFVLSLLVFPFFLAAQCYQPQSLESRMTAADLVVMGRVISSTPFYNLFGEIYTMHELLVDRNSVEGEASLFVSDTISFFTMGGRINEEQTIVYPSLRDITDAEGLFLLNIYRGDRVDQGDEKAVFRPTAVHESVLPFEEETGNFTDGGVVVGDVRSVERLVRRYFSGGLVARTERRYAASPYGGRSLAPSIANLSPLTVNAGVGEEVTITGDGFGSAPGDVFFDNPDDGPGGAFVAVGEEDILAWSDTEITVRVISNAGGGRVLVRTASGQQSTSSQQLRVRYAITNLTLTSGAIVTPLLIDDEADGNGGYAFAVGNTAANGGVSLAGSPAALAALTRAVSTWQTEGDFSIYLEGTTNIQTPSRDDEVNIVAFGSNVYDFDTELGNGTVGIAFSYYNACGSSEFEVSGADVLFRRNGDPNGRGGSVNYNFGPGGGSGTDFESVALHEFGHVHQLKHVADPSEVMSYRITNGTTQRNLSADTRAGADFVAQASLAYDPPIINCGGDFNQERDYQTYSMVNGGVLPVVWLSFTALPREKKVELRWRTHQEVNNAGYLVERSADGFSFTTIAEVAPAVNQAGQGNYQLNDQQPLPGTSYYRIAQKDFSGARTFTEIRQVVRAPGASLRVFPNPVVNVLNVVAATPFAGDIRIFDALGREVLAARQPEAQQARIDVSHLPSGRYLLRTASGESLTFVR